MSMSYEKFLIDSGKFNPLVIHRQAGQQEIRIEISKGVKVKVLILGDFKKIISSLKLHIIIRQSAALNLVENIKGGKRVETACEIELKETGANCLVTGMFLGKKTEEHVCKTIVDHQAANTRADVLVKAVYQNQSRGDFSGLIKINKSSQHANSFYKNEILLLDSAQAISMPHLEISTNRAKASHSSYISRLNQEQLFYLQSHGLSYQQSKREIIAGFLVSALNRLPQVFCRQFLPKLKRALSC